MNHPIERKRGQREVFWLLTLFLLIFVPLGILLRIRTLKEEKVQQQKAALAARTASDQAALKRLIAEPNVNSSPWFRPLKSTSNGHGYIHESVRITLALSPNGKYLAGVLPYHSKVAKPIISSRTPATLVVWEADTKRELVRLPILETAAGQLKWWGNDILTNFSTYAQTWDWKRRKLISPVVTDNPADNEQKSDVNTQSTQTDPLRNIKIHMEHDGTLAAYRASTGQPLPLKVPRELTPEKLNGTHWLLTEGASQEPLILISSTRVEAKKTSPSPTSAPAATASPRTRLIHYGRVIAWDGRSGQVLWRRDFRVSFIQPRLSISPDRTIIAILGTWRPRGASIYSGEETGIEFLNAAKGKTLSSAATNSNIGWFTRPLWLPGHIFCLPDKVERDLTLLSFYNAKTGALQKTWPLPALASDDSPKPSYFSAPRDVPEAWTCDPAGQKWIFASAWGGWRKWTKTQIEKRVQIYQQTQTSKLQKAQQELAE